MKEKPTYNESVECFRVATSVAYVFKVSIDEMKARNRKHPIPLARQYYFYIAKECTGLTFGKIGGYLKRDHATALYGRDKIEDHLQIYPDVQDKIDEIYRYLVRKGEDKNSTSLLLLEKALHLYNNFLTQ